MDPLSDLCTPVLEDVLACLTAADVYRLGAVCKTLRGRVVAAVLGRAPEATKGHVAHIQSFPAHYWGSIAGQLNRQPKATVRLINIPVLADAFAVVIGHEAQAQEQPQQAQQQGQFQANAGGDLPQTAAGLLHADAQRPLYQLAAAAVLVSTWWGAAPAVEVGDGGRQLAIEAVRDCLGDSVADFVTDITRPDACRWPEAACGFWGCMFLGIMASTAVPATSSGIERLTTRLLQLQLGKRGCYAPTDQLRELFAARPVAAEVAANNETEAEGRLFAAPPASDSRSLCCLRHHVREFLSVLLVLLRCEPLASGQLLDRGALEGLHDAILSAMLRHDGQACAAASQWENSCEQALQQQASSNRPAQRRAQTSGCEHVDFAKYGLPSWNMMTAEQRSLIRGAVRRDHRGKTINELVIVNSAAGASKTTTAKAIIVWQQLASMAELGRSCRILYTSYGRDNVLAVKKCLGDLDARKSQDPSLNMSAVTVKTTHMIAARKMKELEGHGYRLRSSFCMRTMMDNLRQIPYYRVRLDQGQPGPGLQHAADVIDVLEKFCTSADPYVTQNLVREVAGDGQNKFPRVKQNPPDYVAIAQQFMDMIGKGHLRGKVFFIHNLYLKLFVEEVYQSDEQLRDFLQWLFDVFVVDETQDMNPITQKSLLSQHGTKVFVGDRHQHIMGFNHAEDALRDAPGLAKQQGIPVRYFGLSISFRLPRPIDSVAFKIQYKLGERSRAIVAGNTAAGAVYTLHQPAQAATGTNTTSAAPACFQQVQLDDVPLPDETILPRQLAMINLNLPPKRPGQQGTAVHLAQLPVDPTTGKRPPLLYLSRYNSTWFEVLAALHVAVLEGKLEQMPKVYLCAQAAGGQGSHSSHTGDGSDAVIEEVAPTLALARLQELCLLRSRGTLTRTDSSSKQRGSYTGYYSWHKLQEHEQKGLLNSELESALDLFRRYEAQIEEIITTITRSQVASKAEAEYIFSTAHKYKGGEEDYVQLADDFIAMADGIRITVVIDEYNLVYVAVTRAQRALIMNADVSRLVLEEAVKPLFLRVDGQLEHAAPAAAADAQQEQEQEQQQEQQHTQQQEQQQQAKCGRCFQDFNDEPGRTSASRLQVVSASSQQLCADCIKSHTIWGELLSDQVGKREYAEGVLLKARQAAQAAAKRAAAGRAEAEKAAAAEAEREDLEYLEILAQFEADGM